MCAWHAVLALASCPMGQPARCTAANWSPCPCSPAVAAQSDALGRAILLDPRVHEVLTGQAKHGTAAFSKKKYFTECESLVDVVTRARSTATMVRGVELHSPLATHTHAGRVLSLHHGVLSLQRAGSHEWVPLPRTHAHTHACPQIPHPDFITKELAAAANGGESALLPAMRALGLYAHGACTLAGVSAVWWCAWCTRAHTRHPLAAGKLPHYLEGKWKDATVGEIIVALMKVPSPNAQYCAKHKQLVAEGLNLVRQGVPAPAA